MRPSNIFWGAVRSIDRAGLPKVAAGLANAACSDRRFSVDADGDRRTVQAEATFVCPDLTPSRYSYVQEQITDNWLWQYRPQAGDVVLDVGAGIGEEAVVLGRMGCRVISVEAHPRTFRCLQKTFEASGLKRVEALQCAIMDKPGEITIGDTDDHLANGVGATAGITVLATTVAAVCQERGLDRLDFLKMNIEGAEREAVLGFGDIDIRHLVISCHDFLNIDALRTMVPVRAALEAQGYVVSTRPEHPMSYTRANLYATKP